MIIEEALSSNLSHDNTFYLEWDVLKLKTIINVKKWRTEPKLRLNAAHIPCSNRLSSCLGKSIGYLRLWPAQYRRLSPQLRDICPQMSVMLVLLLAEYMAFRAELQRSIGNIEEIAHE